MFLYLFYQIFYKVLEPTVHQRSGRKKLTTKQAQITEHPKIFDFSKVNFEFKARQNVGEICETIKNKDMSRLVTIKAVYSKDASSRVSSSFKIFNAMLKEILLK